MNIYKQNNRWKTILAAFAGLIILASLISTNILASKIEQGERKKMQLYASTIFRINEAPEGEEIGYYFNIINNETTIPLISVDDEGEVIDYKNLPQHKAEFDDGQLNLAYLEKQLGKMQASYAPIAIEQPSGNSHYLYYKGSDLLRWLKWFPYIQLFVIALFLASAYYLFSEARKTEQNQVWVAMSKETAHQLGTPISSLLGWIEYLKLSEDNAIQEIVPELEKDVSRLELITDRFSKIGSKPQLETHDIVGILNETVDYMQKRSPKHVYFTKKYALEHQEVDLYPPLFNWVVENLIKNALDAMDGKGKINVNLHEHNHRVVIDITDSGKGIQNRNKNIVFRPGYSTKKRGWGLGLSLSKRIIEEYHGGKLFVLHSEKNKGTTFRIELVKQEL